MRAASFALAITLGASSLGCGRSRYEPAASADAGGLDASTDATLDTPTPDVWFDPSLDAALDAAPSPDDAACPAGTVTLEDGSCAPPLTLGVIRRVGARASYLESTVNGPATLQLAITSPPTPAPSADEALALPSAGREVLGAAGTTTIVTHHTPEAAMTFTLVAFRTLRGGAREAVSWTDDVTSLPLLEIRNATLAGGGSVEIAVFVPDAYRNDPATPRPTVLFLHGWGGATAVPDVMGLAMDDGLLERIVSQPDLYPDFPFFVIAPHCVESVHGGCWGWTNTNVAMAALDDVAAAYPVDAARTYVTGLSTGGQGVFTIASAFPLRFAAAAPIGSTYDAATPVCSMLDVPVWAFHGEFDTLQPPSNSTTYLERLRTACPMAPSQDPTLTLVACRTSGSNHCGWVEAYDGTHGGTSTGFTSIWSWLLSHTR